MPKNIIFLFLLTAVLAFGLIGCAPTVETNAAQLLGTNDAPAAEVEPTAVGQTSGPATDQAPVVEQPAVSSGYPGSETAGQVESMAMEAPDEEIPGGTQITDSYPGPAGIVNQDPDSSGIVNQEPGGSGIVNEGNNVDSGIVNTADDAPGSSPGGPAQGGESGDVNPPAGPEGQGDAASWLVYTNQAYGFQIAYPQAYAVRQPGAQVSAVSGPAPQGIVDFIDPALAQGELATLQPPELAIRLYNNNGRLPLEVWLREAGKLNPDSGLTGEPYDSLAGSGLQICTGAFVAPRCAVYFAHGDAIYELTPLGLVGETMLSTFAFS